MNIFFLDYNPSKAAKYHCDKHVVKMILETAQLLSTTHRVLNGTQHISKSEKGRKKTTYVHPNEHFDRTLYQATHINHPCAQWLRESSYNYDWTFVLFKDLCKEYTLRYGKTHLTYTKLIDILQNRPLYKNSYPGMTRPALAMPDECIIDSDPVYCYRSYYIQHKAEIAIWGKGTMEPPLWFSQGLMKLKQ